MLQLCVMLPLRAILLKFAGDVVPHLRAMHHPEKCCWLLVRFCVVEEEKNAVPLLVNNKVRSE